MSVLHCPWPGDSKDVPSSPKTGQGSMLQLLPGPSAAKLAVLGAKSAGKELSRAMVAGPTGRGEGLWEQQKNAGGQADRQAGRKTGRQAGNSRQVAVRTRVDHQPAAAILRGAMHN
jgi:hypothetical protein